MSMPACNTREALRPEAMTPPTPDMIHTYMRYTRYIHRCDTYIHIRCAHVYIRCAAHMHVILHVKQMRCIHAYIKCNTYIHMYIHQIRYIQTCNCDIQIIHQIRYDAMHTSIRHDVGMHQIRYTHVSTYTSDAIRKYTHQIRRCDTCIQMLCIQIYSRHATHKRASIIHTFTH